MDPLAPVPRGPRPVAGLPAVDARAVVKAWLLELVAAAPLEGAVRLPTADLAREGPELTEAVLAALADDVALARLGRGGDLGALGALAARLTGAIDGAGLIGGIEALRRAVLASVLEAARLDPATTAELVDRIAHVCARIAAAGAGALGPEPSVVAVPESPPPAPTVPPGSRTEPEVPADAEVAAPPPQARPEGEVAPPPYMPPDGDGGEVVALRRVEDPLEALRARETRQAEAVSWRVAVEWRLKRHAQDASPFALMAIEVDGRERLLAAQTAAEVAEGLTALERALAAELRPADQLLGEERGRYWVTAPDTGPAVARLLAERLAQAASSAASHRGTPLTVSIGIATCPEDGEEPDALAERADEAMFAARAAGTPVA